MSFPPNHNFHPQSSSQVPPSASAITSTPSSIIDFTRRPSQTQTQIQTQVQLLAFQEQQTQQAQAQAALVQIQQSQFQVPSLDSQIAYFPYQPVASQIQAQAQQQQNAQIQAQIHTQAQLQQRQAFGQVPVARQGPILSPRVPQSQIVPPAHQDAQSTPQILRASSLSLASPGLSGLLLPSPPSVHNTSDVRIKGGTFPNASVNFEEKAAAVEACKEAAKQVGFHLVMSRSNEKLALLRCERHGFHKSQSAGIREVNSRKCGCEFMVWVRRSGPKLHRVWKVYAEETHSYHNHDSSTQGLRGHGIPRRMTPAQEISRKRRMEEKESKRKTRLLEKAVYRLPDLAYEQHMLEPFLSREIVRLHYEHHHQTCVDKLNRAFESQNLSIATNDLLKQMNMSARMKTHMSAHINHTLYWENLSPPDHPNASHATCPTLHKAIEQRWQSYANFQKEFIADMINIHASGFGWLTVDEHTGILEIMTTRDDDMLPENKLPILAIDVWEHAYYLQYFTDRAAYLTNVFHIINWKVAETRLQAFGTDVAILQLPFMAIKSLYKTGNTNRTGDNSNISGPATPAVTSDTTGDDRSTTSSLRRSISHSVSEQSQNFASDDEDNNGDNEIDFNNDDGDDDFEMENELDALLTE